MTMGSVQSPSEFYELLGNPGGDTIIPITKEA
jgi:hypothetical protein